MERHRLYWGNRMDALNLVVGTFAGIVMLVVTACIIKYFVGFHWETNPGFQWPHFLTLFVIAFCSVFVQELAFRGYPFRILLDKWGEWPTQIVIAILFGLMHVTNTMRLSEILLTMLTTGAGSFLIWYGSDKNETPAPGYWASFRMELRTDLTTALCCTKWRWNLDSNGRKLST